MTVVMGVVAVGAGLLQVMISLGLAIIAFRIWRRLDDVDVLNKRVERTERQTHLLKSIVTNINSYCNRNDEGVNLLLSLVQRLRDMGGGPVVSSEELEQDLAILADEIHKILSALRRSKSMVALGADSEVAVRSALMYLSQIGDAADYESAVRVLLSREFVDTGGTDVGGLHPARQSHLEAWRGRLRTEGTVIVHATWAPEAI